MTEILTPSWKQELIASQNKEGKSTSNRWIQIATVNKNNEPRLRTVIFRDWIKEDTMIIYTDGRSQKIEEIKENNNVEILWLFLKDKTQYRFKGKAYLIKDNIKQWNNLSRKAKETWFWPKPGGEFIKENDLKVHKNLKKPNNFLILGINISSVDILKLVQPKHKRYFWQKEREWECVELNP